MRSVHAFIPFILLLFVGCAYRVDKQPLGAVQKFDLPQEQKVQLSYNYVYQNVFARNCVSCHGNSGNVNLETYANVISQISKIKSSVFVDHSMPKKSSLTNKELSILWTWIEIGAPALPQTGISETPTEPIQPTFESIDKNIFQVTCIKCHAPEKSGKRVLLTKDELMNSPRLLILPGDPDESGLVIALERKDEKRMPPAKEGYAQLKPDQLQAVRDWINKGAAD